ncbi:hypothetical protein ABEB36_001102 [Hypothenemus hampei]|uniref:PDZ domain-containing protein n=1 Tax=Hypothenemus hampei TaxID=57062 RepID=A0ABD1FEC1_HYPHA
MADRWRQMSNYWGVFAIFLISVGTCHAQDQTSTCYGPGSLATAIILTFFGTTLLVAGVIYFRKKRSEANKGNHLILETDPERGGKADFAFDNPGFKDTTLIATSEKSVSKPNEKSKWSHWAALTGLTLKSEKKRALDDTALQSQEVKVVELNSQDFTGLGFNICGNMKDGIYIRDIMHRGPAFESGKLHPGDRINSVTISFEHIVYEDALNILSYASPYQVIIEAKGSKPLSIPQGQTPQKLVHPIYRSASLTDLAYDKKKTVGDDYSSSSNYSSLQKSRSNMATLERKESKSPRPRPATTTPELHKVGIRVHPNDTKSPKMLEQNQNNINIERNSYGIDEVDVKTTPLPEEKIEHALSQTKALDRVGSGIKRDSNGIPMELPEHLQDVAFIAKRNRKGGVERDYIQEDLYRKGKAPLPPASFSIGGGKAFEDLTALASDSEDERHNTSVNTIELNSGDITIHQIENEEKSRRTASTGDLTKIKKPPRSNTGTLERAQSLDITDTSGPGLAKKSTYDAREDLLIDKEPRLSLILDGLTTFQRNKLKTSTEWGNLEDAILNFNENRRQSEPQFNAVMDKVIQIKRESQEIEIPPEVVKQYRKSEDPPKTAVVNKLWPDEEELNFEASDWKRLETPPVAPERTKLKENGTEKPQPVERVSKTENKSLLNRPNSNLSVEFECVKPVPPKRERTPEKDATISINLNSKFSQISPATPFEKQNISEMCSQMAKGRQDCPMIKDEWEQDTATNSTPPLPQSLVDEVMDSYNKNFGNVVTVVQQQNLPDESKKNLHDTTNISDDVKMSMGDQLSDDAKLVSHVTVSNDNLHSLELSINEEPINDVTVIVSKPNNVTVNQFDTNMGDNLIEITETSISHVQKGPNRDVPVEIKEVKGVKVNGENDDYKVEITESKYSTFEVDKKIVDELLENEAYKGIEDESPVISLTEIKSEEGETENKKTYVTEIQVQPQNNEDHLENAFENYVKNFERKFESFESNIQNLENTLEDVIRDEPLIEPEKQAAKIQELAEEQLKTLPEMKFTTSSYENINRKIPEKRHSFELLRSNFEKASGENKSPPRRDSKSRIPIATTTMKTPPMSPERRDSKNLDNENEKALLELMSSSKIKPHNKNISVTSIRSQSKIPSGLPTLSKPPIPPRKNEESNGDSDSSFKQWVFSPNNNGNVTVVGKDK